MFFCNWEIEFFDNLRVSNLLINVDQDGNPIDYFDFDPRVVPTNGRILVSEDSNPECDADSLCENFLRPFEATEYWEVAIGQKFDTSKIFNFFYM